jgi:hypothetical protein
MLDAASMPFVIAGLFVVTGASCGGDVGRFVTSLGDAGGMDATSDGMTQHAVDDASAEVDAPSTDAPPAACASSADCPEGWGCWYPIMNSCPPEGVCFKDTVSDPGAGMCASAACYCTCDGGVAYMDDWGCPVHEGYFSTPTGTGPCDAGGC